MAGKEEVGQGRVAFIAYRLIIGGADGSVVLRRFSSFVELLPKLSKELVSLRLSPSLIWIAPSSLI